MNPVKPILFGYAALAIEAKEVCLDKMPDTGPEFIQQINSSLKRQSIYNIYNLQSTPKESPSSIAILVTQL